MNECFCLLQKSKINLHFVDVIKIRGKNVKVDAGIV